MEWAPVVLWLELARKCFCGYRESVGIMAMCAVLNVLFQTTAEELDKIDPNMVSEDVLNRIRTVMMTVRQPGNYDKVYKDECMFTFDSPISPSGLFINLSTHQAFGDEFLSLDFEKTGNALYLHEKWNKVT